MLHPTETIYWIHIYYAPIFFQHKHDNRRELVSGHFLIHKQILELLVNYQHKRSYFVENFLKIATKSDFNPEFSNCDL